MLHWLWLFDSAYATTTPTKEPPVCDARAETTSKTRSANDCGLPFGDVDLDGEVDSDDLAIVEEAYDPEVDTQDPAWVPATWTEGDVYCGDGIVGDADFMTVWTNLGAQYGDCYDYASLCAELEPLEADIDLDGQVGTTDLLLLTGAWGALGEHPSDVDGNGSVGLTDLIILLAEHGQSLPAMCL